MLQAIIYTFPSFSFIYLTRMQSELVSLLVGNLSIAVRGRRESAILNESDLNHFSIKFYACFWHRNFFTVTRATPSTHYEKINPAANFQSHYITSIAYMIFEKLFNSA